MFSNTLPNSIVRSVVFSLLACTLLLSACSSTPTDATRSISIDQVQVTVAAPGMEPYVFRTSQPGAISVHGMLYVISPMSILPAPDDALYLVPIPTDQPITGIPNFDPDTVPQAEVDERTGEFMFTDIQSGQYTIVAITTGGAQIPVRFMDTATYAIITLEDSQIDTIVEVNELSLP
jgi:hypothetical protein